MLTIRGCRYYVTFIDEYSHYTWIFPMKKKSEVISHFRKFKTQVEKELNGGKEHFSDKFISYLQGEGIGREFLCRHIPQKNGVAETTNRHILRVAPAIMHEKHMVNFYWVEATSITIYLMNLCTTNGVHELTPYEMYVGRKSVVSHLLVFESIVYVHIPDET